MLDRTHQNYSDIENLLWFYFLSKSEPVLQQLKKKKKNENMLKIAEASKPVPALFSLFLMFSSLLSVAALKSGRKVS